MKNYRIFIIAAVALALGACQEKESLAPQKQAIRFTTNLGAFTKATDTSFEEGDAVSLFAEEPINALNVKMVCYGGELVPETPVYWKEDQPTGQYTNFFAVYPYREDWEDYSDLSVFSVNADQRTHELYTASDLLGASYMAYPDCETVPLNFTHRLAKLNVEVYAYNSNKSVADVYLDGAYGKVRLALYHRMSVGTVGEKGTIRLGKQREDLWSAIVPPQSFDFPVVVVMEDGSQYQFEASSQVWMESAKSYTAHIEIYEDTATIDKNIDVENWTPDNDAAFGNYIADEYHMEGYWYLKETDAQKYHSLIYNSFNGEHFEAGVSAAAGTKYELVYENGRRVLTFGLENTASASVGGDYLLQENGSPFAFSASGEFVVKVFPYTGHVLVEADDEVWSIVGNFGDDPWNTDLDMVRESSGIYSIDFESRGQEFKLRCNHNWEKNLGYYDNSPMYGGYFSWLYYNGSNMTLGEAGLYHLELDSRNCSLTVTLIESYVTEEAFSQILGSWQFIDADSNVYNVTISDNGYPQCIVQFNDFNIVGTLDLLTGKIKVCFQRLGEWTWNDYGLVYDYFLAHSEDRNFFLQEDGSVVLFYLEKTADGNILVSPGSYDGAVFNSFEFIIMLQEGDYVGMYAKYGDVFPLPMIWTPAN